MTGASGQTKGPLGLPRGFGDWLGLVTGERGQNEKEGKQKAKPEIPEDSKKWLQSAASQFSSIHRCMVSTVSSQSQ